jgi:Mg2+ and Co2+ transporter CorA
MGIKGLFIESNNLLKSLSDYITKGNSKNLPQNEINRRLGIIQDMSNKLEKLKLNYEKNISKSLMVNN